MRARLVLLGGQTIALGLMMAFLVVPVSALFLDRYGASRLPYVYLGVAASGVAVSLLMSRAQRRLPLSTLAVTVIATYVVAVAAGWGVLVGLDSSWVTYPLVVLFPLSIPVGFVLVGSQAGRLLDVRQMKAHFPRVAAGFSVGFAIGGLAAAALVPALGGPRHLLLVDLLAGLAMLTLVAATARRFPELRVPPAPPAPVVARRPGPRVDPTDASLRSLLANRMVALILGYQLLSAAVTQLLDYLVWERAAARYPDPGDLAQFQGVFGGIINVVSVMFVMLFAGWLLTRFGVGFGLAANPLGVLVVLAATVVAGYVAGPVGFVFFALVCAQQVVDITFTDGTTRTAINASYQALLPERRLRAQTVIEGAGVPVALGFVGVLLLVFDALALGVRAVLLVTVVLTVAWVVTAVLAYREYGVNLREVISRRAWDRAALRIDDDASRAVVAQLLTSPDAEDVHAALDALVDAGQDVTPQVVELLEHPDPARRELGVEAATAADRIDTPAVAGALSALLDDPVGAVRLAAAAASVRLPEGRSAPAQAVWLAALAGGEADRSSALRAAACYPAPFFVPHLVALVSAPGDSAAALAALSAHADQVAPLLEALLSERQLSRRTSERVVRLLGRSTSDEAGVVLHRYLDDQEPGLARAAAEALVARGRREPATGTELGRRLTVVAERTHRCLQVQRELERQPHAEPLLLALLDEVDGTARHAGALLGLVHDPHAVSAAIARLAAPEGRERNAALEVLEVTVGRPWSPLALALVDPVADATRRDRVLADHTPVAPRSVADWLRDLVLDADGYWRDPWLRACALYALADQPSAEATALAPAFVDDVDPDVAATARWLVDRQRVPAPS